MCSGSHQRRSQRAHVPRGGSGGLRTPKGRRSQQDCPHLRISHERAPSRGTAKRRVPATAWERARPSKSTRALERCRRRVVSACESRPVTDGDSRLHCEPTLLPQFRRLSRIPIRNTPPDGRPPGTRTASPDSRRADGDGLLLLAFGRLDGRRGLRLWRRRHVSAAGLVSTTMGSSHPPAGALAQTSLGHAADRRRPLRRGCGGPPARAHVCLIARSRRLAANPRRRPGRADAPEPRALSLAGDSHWRTILRAGDGHPATDHRPAGRQTARSAASKRGARGGRAGCSVVLDQLLSIAAPSFLRSARQHPAFASLASSPRGDRHRAERTEKKSGQRK